MSVLDEWLKQTPEDPDVGGHDAGGVVGVDHSDPLGVVSSGLSADLQLPDLGLSDIKWWVDLEFLDLASGPPANVGGHLQDKNRSKNPTLDYHFPDIFFDMTSNLFNTNDYLGVASSSAGVANNSASTAANSVANSSANSSGGISGRTGGGDVPAAPLIGGDNLADFEKGLLADLFPPAAPVTHHHHQQSEDAEKLLFDLPPEVVGNEGTAAAAGTTQQEGQLPAKVEPADAVAPGALPAPLVSGKVSRSPTDKGCVGSMSSIEAVPSATGETVGVDGPAPENEGIVYSVPADVLDSISKNFRGIQAEFEKAAADAELGCVETCPGKVPDLLQPEDDKERRVLRIKSVHQVDPSSPLSCNRAPSGTVARLEIKTDRQLNVTKITVLPPEDGETRTGSKVPDSLLILSTSSIAKATKMMKPLHLEKLPILRDVLKDQILRAADKQRQNQGRPHRDKRDYLLARDVGSSARRANGNEEGPQDLQIGTLDPIFVEEEELLRDLAQYGVHYDRVPCFAVPGPDGKAGTRHMWTCPERSCSRLFEKRSKVKLHIFSHHDIRPFVCDFENCKWSFPTAFKLKLHRDSAHRNLKLYACNLEACRGKNVVFSTAHNLNQHLKRHARPHNFNCSVQGCTEAFQTRKALAGHLKAKNHSKTAKPKRTNGQVQSSSLLLTEPLPGVVNGDCVVCQVDGCGKRFADAKLLAQHQRSHDSDRNYKCMFPGCNWSFKAPSKLRRHERKHNNDRKHVCNLCGKAFLRPEHLRGHAVSAHSGVKFACPMEACKKQFSAKSSLYVHLKSGCKTGRNSSRQQPPCGPSINLHNLAAGPPVLVEAEDNNSLCLRIEGAGLGDLNPDAVEDRHSSTAMGVETTSAVVAAASSATADLDFIALLSSVADDDPSGGMMNVTPGGGQPQHQVVRLPNDLVASNCGQSTLNLNHQCHPAAAAAAQTTINMDDLS